jgi:acyl-CoA thioester hydrolase
MSASRPLLVELAFEAKTYDIDFAGIVSNIVYIRWLEDLRLKFLAQHYPLDRQQAERITPVLRKTEIHYRRPLRLLDRPVGQMWVGGVARARWELQAELHLGDTLIANATQVGYFVDLRKLRPVAMPQALHDRWLAARTQV